MKIYDFYIPPSIIKYNSSIRNKISIIHILIEILRYLITMSKLEQPNPQINDKNNIHLIIHIDKTSRIFIEEPNKIHTFSFPFSLRNHDNKFLLFFYDFEISDIICSTLAATFHNISDDEPLEEILEHYWNIVSEFMISKEESQLCCRLITYLLTFEPGYIRFDHDTINKDPNFHPENHLDFNYTNSVSLKLGLKNNITYSQLLDILSRYTPCHYLVSCSPSNQTNA